MGSKDIRKEVKKKPKKNAAANTAKPSIVTIVPVVPLTKPEPKK